MLKGFLLATSKSCFRFIKMLHIESSSDGILQPLTPRSHDEPNFLEKCAATVYEIAAFLIKSIIIWSVAAEILLLINIYELGSIYFILSCTFLIGSLLITSIIICLVLYSKGRYALLIPILNFPFSIFLSTNLFANAAISNINFVAKQSVINLILTSFMIFPLYFVNIAYILDTNRSFADISTFNWMQLIASLVNICINPVIVIITRSNMEQNFDNICTSLKRNLTAFFAIVPIIFLEAIQFLPYLFCYFMNDSFSKLDLIIVLAIFNGSKLIFLIHFLRKFCAEYNCLIRVLLFLVVMLVSLAFPLIPYTIEMYENSTAQQIKSVCDCIGNGFCSPAAKYYFTLLFYVWFAYGASIGYVLVSIGWFALSLEMQLTLVLVICIVIHISLTFLSALHLMKRINLHIFS